MDSFHWNWRRSDSQSEISGHFWTSHGSTKRTVRLTSDRHERQSVMARNAALNDGTGAAGTSGQLLSSTVTGTAWIDQSTLAIAQQVTGTSVAMQRRSRHITESQSLTWRRTWSQGAAGVSDLHRHGHHGCYQRDFCLSQHLCGCHREPRSLQRCRSHRSEHGHRRNDHGQHRSDFGFIHHLGHLRFCSRWSWQAQQAIQRRLVQRRGG